MVFTDESMQQHEANEMNVGEVFACGEYRGEYLTGGGVGVIGEIESRQVRVEA